MIVKHGNLQGENLFIATADKEYVALVVGQLKCLMAFKKLSTQNCIYICTICG